MRKILFVDDEGLILQAIQRSLRSMRGEWEMAFAASPAEALEKMREGAFDLVVTDMRMPGSDGVTLLENVKTLYPQTVRFVLSGQCDRDAILRSTGPAHQFLAKPCEMSELKNKVAQALAFGEAVGNPEIRKLVSGLSSVPSPPALYLAVMDEIQSSDPSIAKVGRIVSRDPSMTAKILQMVNSSFFGLRCRVASAEQAVTLLGLDIISALVLCAHVFSQFKGSLVAEFSLQTIAEYALLTASLAKKLALGERSPIGVQDESFTAGILHDIGKLILATGFPAKYRKCLELVNENKIPDWQAEREVFSCTHAEVGAYLLGIWGLPTPIVEAVAWHHRPSESALVEFHPVLAVHVAAAFVENMEGTTAWNDVLDGDFLERLSMSREEKEAQWADLFWKAVAGVEAGAGVPRQPHPEMSGAAK